MDVPGNGDESDFGSPAGTALKLSDETMSDHRQSLSENHRTNRVCSQEDPVSAAHG